MGSSSSGFWGGAQTALPTMERERGEKIKIKNYSWSRGGGAREALGTGWREGWGMGDG